MDKHKRNIIIIIGIIVVVFALIILITLQLAKKEEKTEFKVSPMQIDTKSDEKVKGLLVGYADSVVWVNPDNAIIVGKKITVPSTPNSFDFNHYKVSPNNKYLAVLSPVDKDTLYNNEETKDIKNAITIYDLATGDSHELVTANSNTYISSFSWDWSGDAIGFVTTKRINYNSAGTGLFLFLLPSSSASNKTYLNKVDITAGTVSTKEYPHKTYSSSISQIELLSLNSDTYYLKDMGYFITFDTKIEQENKSDDTYYMQDVYVSNNYKAVVMKTNDKIIYLNLEKKEKQSLTIGTGNLANVKVSNIAISQNLDGIAFAKQSSAGDQKTNIKTIYETVWYYSFQTQQFSQLSTKQLSSDKISSDSNKNNITFSPSGDKIVMATEKDDVSKPVVEQTLQIFDVGSTNSSQLPIKFSQDYVKILSWK